jgi:hypothetical protein
MPAINFYLFSSDATGNPPNKDTADTLIALPFPKNLRDKEAGSIFQAPEGRGSVHITLEGIVVQDFGIPSNFSGGQIFLEDTEAIDATVKNALETAYLAEDTDWYFTDSIDIYKVKFSRNPVGFHSWLSYAIYAATGKKVYSYSMNLIIVKRVV